MKKLILPIWLGIIAGIYLILDHNKPKPKEEEMLQPGRCVKTMTDKDEKKVLMIIHREKKKGEYAAVDVNGRLYMLRTSKGMSEEEFAAFSKYNVKVSQVNCNDYF